MQTTSSVVSIEDFATGGSGVAQGGQIEPFEGVHIVFLFALRVREVAERLSAQAEGEEMARRAFGAIDRGGVNGGPMPPWSMAFSRRTTIQKTPAHAANGGILRARLLTIRNAAKSRLVR